ncbi:DUF5316 domain-containing protein [Ectobacillus ponti]|uniref:DUF5316 domain-containing protein n=1 Tax=Ectobacillus ponti TaxID=2961894 RepID=A0AA42BQX8_9BACI|nr:DUF5316 domain-containing protein [Ectobacillus ponti]
MKQYFELGLCVAALTGIIAVLLQDWYIVYQFSGLIGITAIVFAGLLLLTARSKHVFSGKSVSLLLQRRKQFAAALLVFSMPNLLAAGLSMLFR